MIIEILAIYFSVMNIIGFFIMGIDKKKAVRKQWRIREGNLFLIAILGGSIGSIIGMQVFRHKTKHKRFVIGIPCILIGQMLILFWLI